MVKHLFYVSLNQALETRIIFEKGIKDLGGRMRLISARSP